MIKYIGSKRLLIPHIMDLIEQLPNVRTVADFFSGTSRVGHALKQAGYRVHANDHLTFAHTLAQCYVQTDATPRLLRKVQLLVDEFNALAATTPPTAEPGYFTRTFCHDARYFQPKNGLRIERIREAIDAKCLPPDLRAVMLTSLMEASDRVDSTTGLQMAYLKKWSQRSHNDLQLRVPRILPASPKGPCMAHCLDAHDAAEVIEADVAYIDPPYNQHSYLGNYHIWETLVRWDNPTPYGIACKRDDCKTRKSPFNSKPRAKAALESLLSKLKCRYVIISFNDEGFISSSEMLSLLQSFSHQSSIQSSAVAYNRYVGAKIGIHDQKGTVVGQVSHLDNHEHLYLYDTQREAATLEVELRTSAPLIGSA